MISVVLTGWLLAVSIQLLFILFVFGRLAFTRQTTPSAPAGPPTPVTVVVCAHNELDNLRDLLPLLQQQQYPEFEILVMDDRSTDGSDAYLEALAEEYPVFRTIRIDQEYEHVTPKKYALTIALKKALHPVVLLTDADCRPASADWLGQMVAHTEGGQKAVVLGFSPYRRYPGLLNFLIRAETLSTAVQYLSMALLGRPYMGVGRNLLYTRSLFFEHRGFYTHMNVLGGDDDLFINQVATGRNTAVSLDPDTFMWSAPKRTWSAWRQQKRRHLNVGRFYKWGDKLALGLLTGSHILSWVLALLLGVFVGWLFYSGQPGRLANTLLLSATGLFGLRLLLYWLMVGRASYRLGHTVHWAAVPLMDLTLAMYYALMGLRMVFTRRKNQVW